MKLVISTSDEEIQLSQILGDWNNPFVSRSVTRDVVLVAAPLQTCILNVGRGIFKTYLLFKDEHDILYNLHTVQFKTYLFHPIHIKINIYNTLVPK